MEKENKNQKETQQNQNQTTATTKTKTQKPQQNPLPSAAEDENHIIAERLAKLDKLRSEGPAYPNDFVKKDTFGEIRAKYGEESAEQLEANPVEVAVAGRLMLKRVMGKASFATVRDGTGSLQFFISKGEVGDETYDFFKKVIDIGDV